MSRNTRSLSSAAGKADNQQAVLSAKKEIRSKLREDWSWPIRSAEDGNEYETGGLNLPSNESDWEVRGSDTSCEAWDSPDVTQPLDLDPDHVARPLQSRKRKRKRHQMLQEELQWNTGLCHFTERRDAWSGARRQPVPSTPRITRSRDSEASTNETKAPTSIDYRPKPPMKQYNKQPPPDKGETSDIEQTLIPRAPPILPPHNSVRAAITPSTYDSIYSKVIIQGLSPTIPINLSDIVSSLVQGWKKDGEWPPKTEAEKAEMQDRGDGGGVRDEGRKLAKKGVGRMKKAFGLGLGPGPDQGGDGRLVEEGSPF